MNPPPRLRAMTNRRIADRLEEAAGLLERQGANPFKVGAFRRAATAVANAPDVQALADRDGAAGLRTIPGVGPGIAAAILEMQRTGRWGRLDMLRGDLDPQFLFQAVPGIGSELAQRIHEQLDIATLEELELAAHDGRLEHVPGIGRRRAMAIRAGIAHLLGPGRSRTQPAGQEPSVDMLLDVDRQYREAVATDSLPTIAPRRFNPLRRSWLPILHAERGPWHFSALFSNTGLAHKLGRTRDWVTIFFHQDDLLGGRRTVVTETHGPLAGRRVVRGREPECLQQALSATEPATSAGIVVDQAMTERTSRAESGSAAAEGAAFLEGGGRRATPDELAASSNADAAQSAVPELRPRPANDG